MSLRPLAPAEADPFATHPDGSPWLDERPEPLNLSEADRADALRRKRDDAAKKRAKTKRLKTDLESKSRELLRGMGFVYDRTEHVGFTGWKSDLFGFVDGVAIRTDQIWFVQTTSRDNKAAHLKTMARGTFKVGGGGVETPCIQAAMPLARAGLLLLVLWDQPGGKGTAWRHQLEAVTPEALEAAK